MPGGVSSCHHRCVLSVCVETSGLMHVCCCLEVHASLMRFLPALNLTAAACRFPAVETAGAAAERASEYSWQPLPASGPRSRQPRPHCCPWPLLPGHEQPPRASLDSWSPALCHARLAAAGPSLSEMLVRGELGLERVLLCPISLGPRAYPRRRRRVLIDLLSSALGPSLGRSEQSVSCHCSTANSSLICNQRHQRRSFRCG